MNKDSVKLWALPISLFGYAIFLRMYFFSGFVLCDDPQEFGTIETAVAYAINLKDQFHLRFGGWFFNWIAMRLLGASELSFFLPTVLMSASFPVIAYALMQLWGYSKLQAFLAGLLVASAPFEVLVGGLRANDLIFSWFLALGLWSFFALEKRPILQGAVLAFLWWCAFYTKLWVIYLFPALGIYYIVQLVKYRRWAGWVSFSLATLFFHIAIGILWKIKLGEFLPYLHNFAPTYPVAAKDLPHLFSIYPGFLFKGSEFGSTLFGYVPYLLIALLALKSVLSYRGRGSDSGIKFDRVDIMLMVYYLSFFALMNFFSASFKFDQFYSPGRIFRYLTPLSLPMVLHVAKLLIDLMSESAFKRRLPVASMWLVFLSLIGLSIYQSAEATGPGREHRRAWMTVINDIKTQRPAQVVIDSWIAFFMRAVYFRDVGIEIVTPVNVYSAADYEKWLSEKQADFPKGTWLVSGFCGCVHYGPHGDGFRLKWFSKPLNPGWVLKAQYDTLSYLLRPEPTRIWVWNGPSAVDASAASQTQQATVIDADFIGKEDFSHIHEEGAKNLFELGMKYFDKGDHKSARPYFQKVMTLYPDDADTAMHFYAITYFRENDWRMTIKVFEKLLALYPGSSWSAAAHYHIGVGYKNMGNHTLARREFEAVLEKFRENEALSRLAEEQLGQMPGGAPRRGILQWLGF